LAEASSARILERSLKPGNRRAGSILKVATRKLTQLEAAATLEFLRSPPGNQLEALKGDRQGQLPEPADAA
jgi:plasmid maintenance system killer protein